MPDFTKFDKHAPQMIRDLMHDFGLKDWQAAAFVGNAAAESAYFTDIVEDGALAKGWKGGTGWFQWTGMGTRRGAFEAWLKRKGWTADSYEGNYSFLYRELAGLEGTEKKIVDQVKATDTMEEAVRLVCSKFLRPAVNNYGPRYAGATRALNLFRANPSAYSPTKWATDAKGGDPAPVATPATPPVVPLPDAPKPWYTSKTNITAYVSAAAGLLATWGLPLDEEARAALTTVIFVVTPVLVQIFRARVTEPIAGTKAAAEMEAARAAPDGP